jgi:hypothetical protein
MECDPTPRALQRRCPAARPGTSLGAPPDRSLAAARQTTGPDAGLSVGLFVSARALFPVRSWRSSLVVAQSPYATTRIAQLDDEGVAFLYGMLFRRAFLFTPELTASVAASTTPPPACGRTFGIHARHPHPQDDGAVPRPAPRTKQRDQCQWYSLPHVRSSGNLGRLVRGRACATLSRGRGGSRQCLCGCNPCGADGRTR